MARARMKTPVDVPRSAPASAEAAAPVRYGSGIVIGAATILVLIVVGLVFLAS